MGGFQSGGCLTGSGCYYLEVGDVGGELSNGAYMCDGMWDIVVVVVNEMSKCRAIVGVLSLIVKEFGGMVGG